MKLARMIFLVLPLVFVFQLAIAQDPVKVAPNNYKMIFENDRVRVHEVTVKAGDKVPTHSHPDHFAYLMTPCKLKITNAAGKVNEADGKMGDVMWVDAETHSTDAGSDCRVLVVELKEPKPKM